MIDDIEILMDRFNEEMRQNPELRDGLRLLDRSIQIEFEDNASACNLRLVGGEAAFLCDGPVKSPDRPDIRIIMVSQTMKGILDGTIDPTTAFRDGRIRIDGSIFDKILLRSALSL
jgi:putative sterol carrier protein